jgi:hypothetical protein
MHQEEESVALEEKAAGQNNIAVNLYRSNYRIIIAVCAVLTVIFMKTGFFSLFFLVPLGYAVLVTGSLWLPFFAAAILNIVVSVFLQIFADNNSSPWMDIFYFSVVMLMFTWIIGGRNVRTAFRYILAASAGAIAFLVFIMGNRNDTSFNLFLVEMSKMLTSMFSSPANDAAIQQAFSPERLLELIRGISFRGGALVSMLVVFFLNHRLTLTIVRLVKRQQKDRSLGIIQFFAPPNTVWVLSGALVTVVLTSMFRIDFIEIIAWNVLIACGIIFMTQGAGIIMYLLAKRTLVFRIIASLSIVFLIVSPLSTIAIISLMLLGIAEIWLPLRAKKENNQVFY